MHAGKSETTLDFFLKTERNLVTAICKSAPHITSGMKKDVTHLHMIDKVSSPKTKKANEYFFGLVFVCARFKTINNWVTSFMNRCPILSTRRKQVKGKFKLLGKK